MEEANDPLIECDQQSKLEDLIRILRQDIDQNRLGIALFEAVRQGNTGIVGYLLCANAPLGLVNFGDGKTTTALHIASELGHLEMVEMLIDMGSNPNLRDSGNRNPLHRASCYGHIPVIAKLLDSGMDIESPGFQGRTPLTYAVCERQIDTVRFLVDRGASVNACEIDGMSSLMFACNTRGQASDAAIVRLLIEKGADIEARALNKGFTALMYAVIHSDAKTNATVVAELIAAGANLEARSREKESTALHLSIGTSSLGAFKLLLDAGADVQAVNKHGSSMWHYLGLNFDKENLNEWVELLLSTGVSINSKARKGHTPLFAIMHRVTFNPSSEMDRRAPGALEMFLKAGADAAALENKKNGLLHFLISNFYTKCCSTSDQLNDPTWPDKCRSAAQFIRMLANAGAMPSENRNGYSPMYYLKNKMGEAAFNEHRNRLAPVLVALVSAGDYLWSLLPLNAPLPGLGGALIDVWRKDRAKLPYIFDRMSSDNQERVRSLLKCLRFGNFTGQGTSGRDQNARSLPEELRIQIISYALAAE